jgi:hypothetical protein
MRFAKSRRSLLLDGLLLSLATAASPESFASASPRFHSAATPWSCATRAMRPSKGHRTPRQPLQALLDVHQLHHAVDRYGPRQWITLLHDVALILTLIMIVEDNEIALLIALPIPGAPALLLPALMLSAQKASLAEV